MHQAVIDCILEAKKKYPDSFKNKRVLEVGSLDINGSIRSYFNNCDYTGLDIGPGPGVDIVCPIHKFGRHLGFNAPHPLGDLYDTVVSTEMLEHDIHWKKSLQSMYENLKPGGLFILTCAGPARHEHGTTRTTPGDSPYTNEYYRNISKEDFFYVLPMHRFEDYDLKLVRADTDLQFIGIKN